LQNSEHDMYKCRYCGATLIFDSETYSYVCPVCGVVYDYGMLPSYAQLSHVAPLERQDQEKLSSEVVKRASELFGKSVAKELLKMDRIHAEEVLRALEAIVNKQNYTVSWDAMRKAIEIASKHRLATDIEELREKRIREEIERFVREAELNIDPKEVWYFAVRYKRLWAGRKSSTLARVFTYLYCKKRLGIDIKLESRIVKVAKALEKVLSYE